MRALHFTNTFVVFLTLFGCANMGAPSGGEKDMNSPVLISTVPDNYSIFFEANEIRLRFDEYVVIDESKLVVSPPLDGEVKLSLKGKEVRIILEAELRSNTTYTISIEEAIKDLNESNPYRGEKFIFSTGAFLDSGQFQGYVRDPFQAKGPENFVIGLFSKNLPLDSLFVKKPIYYTRTTENARFSFEYLSMDSYSILAFEDLDGDLIPNLSSDRIAFLPSTIDLLVDSFSILTIYQEEGTPAFRSARQMRNGKIGFAFQNGIQKWEIENLSRAIDQNIQEVFWKLPNEDSVIYWYQGFETDSMIFVLQQDTIKDTTLVYFKDKKISSSFEVKSKIKDGIHHKRDGLELEIPTPGIVLDRNKIKVFRDEKELEFELIDSLWEFGVCHLQTDFEFGEEYSLKVSDSAFIDIYGRTNDTLFADFKIPLEREYGGLRIKLPSEDSTTILVQLWSVESGRIIQPTKIEKNEYHFQWLEAGTFYLKLISDLNENGQWDPGKVSEGRVAEKVYFYDVQFQVRENWDLEHELTQQLIDNNLK